MRQAIQIAQEIDDVLEEGIHLSNLGNIYKAVGKFPEAIESYTRAVQIFQRLEDKRNESGSLCRFGECLRKSRRV